MNSTTAYILICMLLLSALISLIVLLITVSEQPDLLLSEEPPKRFFDLSKYNSASSSTAATQPTLTEEQLTTEAQPTFMSQTQNFTFTKNLTTARPKSVEPTTSTITTTLTPTVDITQLILQGSEFFKMAMTDSTPQNSMFTTSVTAAFHNSDKNIDTNKAMDNSSGTVSTADIRSKQIGVNMLDMLMRTALSTTTAASQRTTLAGGADADESARVGDFPDTSFATSTHLIMNEDSHVTSGDAQNSQKTSADNSKMSIFKNSQMLSSSDDSRTTAKTAAGFEKFSSDNSEFGFKQMDLPAQADLNFKAEADEKRISLAALASATAEKESITNAEESTPQTTISQILSNSSQPPRNEVRVMDETNASNAPTAASAAATVADVTTTAPSVSTATKAARSLSTARILDANASHFAVSAVRELSTNDLFGRERHIEEIALDKIFAGTESASDAPSGKYLSILVDDERQIYLPKNNGEIRHVSWSEAGRTLGLVASIQTQLRRIHRLKLISTRDEDESSRAANSSPVDGNNANEDEKSAKFVAVDGDRLRRLVLLDASGRILPNEAEIPSSTGAKDLSAYGDRVFVLSRQNVNGTSEIFVYDKNLRFERQIALKNPKQENCNFIEAGRGFVHVSCQSAVLAIALGTAQEGVIAQRFGIFEGSYSLASQSLPGGYLLAAQRGREELHLFNANAELKAKLSNKDANSPPAIWSSLAVVGNSTIFALEYVSNKINVFRVPIDLQHIRY